ncbi:MAG: hypothetical protein WC666_04075 [Candidatus Paceibacterota bacterium]|jgi:hypothetical protein
MKNYFLVAFVVGLFISNIGTSFAQGVPKTQKTLADFGLTEESVKYLTKDEINKILNSLTPAETIEKIKKMGTSTKGLPGILPSLVQSFEQPKGTVDCFDYYRFGSVQAYFSSGSSSVVPGTEMDFSGIVENSNEYPIVGGKLYVKVMRERTVEKEANGPDVVDQFVIKDGISIPANGSVSLSFKWKVPLYSEEGNYSMTFFFVTENKFNLLGLSFTDDVIGNTTDFQIKGNTSILKFDKAGVTINDKQYLFAAYPPRIPSAEKALIEAKVVNSTGKDELAEITWKLYRWDSMDPEKLIRTVDKSVLVKAKSSKIVQIEIPENNEPVYYVVGELKYRDTKSILGIRFVRPEVDRIRLNFPSITSFPIYAGAVNTMFSCLHNGGSSPVVKDGRLVLILKDDQGNTIDSYTYEGIVTGEMIAVKKDFQSAKDLDKFTLKTELWQGSRLVDSSVSEYDCNKIDPSKCNKDFISTFFAGPSKYLILTGIVTFLAILFIILEVYKKKMKAKKLLLLILFLPMLSFAFPNVSEAKSIIWLGMPPDLQYYWNNLGLGGSNWAKALSRVQASVKYYADIVNKNTGQVVQSGDSVPVGTELELKFPAHSYLDVFWFGSGFSSDSPYGEWRVDAAPPAVSCNKDKDFLSDVNLWDSVNPNTIIPPPPHYLGVYIPLVISPPAKGITNTDGMICGKLLGDETSGYSMTCTVSNVGTLTPKFNFGSTYGKFYYRYYNYKELWVSAVLDEIGCFGNNIPMKSAGSNPYILNVPAKSITYSLQAVKPEKVNHPPTTPVISGPTTGSTETSHYFDIVSTDEDKDKISYGIDWDNNGSADEWSDPTGSNIPINTAKSWTDEGENSFKVIAIDSNGGRSSWAIHTINLEVSKPTAVISANPISISKDSVSMISWGSANANVCSVTRNGGPWVTGIVGGNYIIANTSGEKSSGYLNTNTNFEVICNGPGGIAKDSVTVTLKAPVTGTCTASPKTLSHVGGAVTYTANPSGGGSGVYSSYAWYSSDGKLIANETKQTYESFYPKNEKSIEQSWASPSVVIIDSNGNKSSSIKCEPLTVTQNTNPVIIGNCQVLTRKGYESFFNNPLFKINEGEGLFFKVYVVDPKSNYKYYVNINGEKQIITADSKGEFLYKFVKDIGTYTVKFEVTDGLSSPFQMGIYNCGTVDVQKMLSLSIGPTGSKTERHKGLEDVYSVRKGKSFDLDWTNRLKGRTDREFRCYTRVNGKTDNQWESKLKDLSSDSDGTVKFTGAETLNVPIGLYTFNLSCASGNESEGNQVILEANAVLRITSVSQGEL